VGGATERGAVNNVKRMPLKFLRYITNNEAQSRHEEIFDVIFWVVETVALVVGAAILLWKHDGEWVAFLVIEYCWAMDNLRHNRP
jgi:hypothetical protein